MSQSVTKVGIELVGEDKPVHVSIKAVVVNQHLILVLVHYSVF